MKEMLERHTQKLTAAERRSVWEAIALRRSPAARRWAVPALASAATVVLVALLVFRQGPAPVVKRAEIGESQRTTPVRSLPYAGSADRAPATLGAGGQTPGPAQPAGRPAAPAVTRADHPAAVAARRADRRMDEATREAAPSVVEQVPAESPAAPASPSGEAALASPPGGAGSALPPAAQDKEETWGTMKPRPGDRLARNIPILPREPLNPAIQKKADDIAQGGNLHFRGGRGGEVNYQVDGIPATPRPTPPAGQTWGVVKPLYAPNVSADMAASLPPARSAPDQPPVYNTTGGSTLPNDEPYDSMFFRHYGVNPFIATDEDALSTFAVDVDNASYTVAQRYIELGHLPPAEAVRVEEFVNYFPQGYPRFGDTDFRIFMDGAPSPFGRGYELLRIGLKAREIADADRAPADLAFVIDVSGSMEREGRLDLVKSALRILVDRLRDGDRVGLVVFSTRGRILMDPIALGERRPVYYAERGAHDVEAVDMESGRQRILEAIERLHPESSTNLEEGLRLGYEMAENMFRGKANNRVILCTDGVANEGNTGSESILKSVRSEADRGIYLSALGFGMGNYNDVLLEQLADRGDGNYYYVDNLEEARRVLVENLSGTLQTIARDAKVQVEFEPKRVLRYRLLGFENRDVADRDFRNDKVDAGEIGAGHQVVALYEVKLAPGTRSGKLATVRLRYAKPGQRGGAKPDVREIESDFDAGDLETDIDDASPYLRFDAAVAEFAEILRGSYWARGSRIEDVLPIARPAARKIEQAPFDEFVSMAERAVGLSAQITPDEREGRTHPEDWEKRQWEWREEGR